MNGKRVGHGGIRTPRPGQALHLEVVSPDPGRRIRPLAAVQAVHRAIATERTRRALPSGRAFIMASPGLIWLPGRLYGDFVGTATHFVRDEESRPRGAGRWKWYAYTVYVAGTRVKFRRKSELEQGVK